MPKKKRILACPLRVSHVVTDEIEPDKGKVTFTGTLRFGDEEDISSKVVNINLNSMDEDDMVNLLSALDQRTFTKNTPLYLTIEIPTGA